MLKIDMVTEPGGVRVNWRAGEGLSLVRRNGTLIMKIQAPYADERALITAAQALNKVFRNVNASAPSNSPSNARDHKGDGGKA